MFDLDEENIECTLGNKDFCFWRVIISEVRVRGIYLSLTLGTAKQLE